MRFENWERRLNATVRKYERLPLKWGEHDCVLFAAECVHALTQKDPGLGYRRTYSDAAGALRLISEHGGLESLVETALASVGIVAERIAPTFMQRGDVCLVETEGRPALGVCLGSVIAGKSEDGLERRPLSAATVAWAIR